MKTGAAFREAISGTDIWRVRDSSLSPFRGSSKNTRGTRTFVSLTHSSDSIVVALEIQDRQLYKTYGILPRFLFLFSRHADSVIIPWNTGFNKNRLQNDIKRSARMLI